MMQKKLQPIIQAAERKTAAGKKDPCGKGLLQKSAEDQSAKGKKDVDGDGTAGRMITRMTMTRPELLSGVSRAREEGQLSAKPKRQARRLGLMHRSTHGFFRHRVNVNDPLLINGVTEHTANPLENLVL